MSITESYVSVQVENSESKKTPARRSELEIKMDVLQVVSQGIDRPTQIMYKANLSWIALQENLKALVAKSFLREENLGQRRRYELTQRGFEILRIFRTVLESMSGTPVVQKQVSFRAGPGYSHLAQRVFCTIFLNLHQKPIFRFWLQSFRNQTRGDPFPDGGPR